MDVPRNKNLDNMYTKHGGVRCGQVNDIGFVPTAIQMLNEAVELFTVIQLMGRRSRPTWTERAWDSVSSQEVVDFGAQLREFGLKNGMLIESRYIFKSFPGIPHHVVLK